MPQAVINYCFMLCARECDVLERARYSASIGADARALGDEFMPVAAIRALESVVRYLVALGYLTGVTTHMVVARNNAHMNVLCYLEARGADKSRANQILLHYIASRKANNRVQAARAARALYFWWVPRCYRAGRRPGPRMARRNYYAYLRL